MEKLNYWDNKVRGGKIAFMEWNFFNKNQDEVKNMKNESINEFFKQSSDWQKKAAKYINNPREAKRLLNEAVNKASKNAGGPLQDIWDSLQVLFSLIKDWILGEYKGLPSKSLLLILAGILYFVTPIDIIPEFVLGLGLLDDAVVLGWIINQVAKEIEEYKQWKGSGEFIDIEFTKDDEK